MKVRRVLIYEGPEEWVKMTLSRGWVQGLRELCSGKMSIREEEVTVLPEEAEENATTTD